MEYPKMLYRLGGSEEIHGGEFSTRIVDDEEAQESALAAGWHLTTTEAAAPVEHDGDAPPTRDELEAKATELGLKFDGRTGDKKLAALIAEKLAG